jgi:peptide-methionine (S)-S-oxide reductase
MPGVSILMKIFTRMLFLACLAGISSTFAAEMNDTKSSSYVETAVFGGGCFWCLDAQFKLVNGVKSVVSGYAGGTTKNPSYEQVCTETTGHAEVIQVEYDPAVVTYADLLRKFFHAHDPTTLNRQGPDVGTSYRSIILYRDANQKTVAEEIKSEAQKDWPDPIVTEIVPLQAFYKAEDYHQDYFAKNPTQGYCRVVVAPKVKKFEKMLQEEKH